MTTSLSQSLLANTFNDNDEFDFDLAHEGQCLC